MTNTSQNKEPCRLPDLSLSASHFKNMSPIFSLVQFCVIFNYYLVANLKHPFTIENKSTVHNTCGYIIGMSLIFTI